MFFTRQRSTVAVLALGVLVDAAISLLSLGFFNAQWSFDLSLLLRQLSVFKYDFLRTLHEFVVCLVLRNVFVITGVLLRLLQKNGDEFKRRTLVLLGFATASWSFVNIKILAISEYPEQLKYLGLWASVAWLFVATSWTVAVWVFILPSAWIQPLSSIGSAVSDTEPLISDDDAEAAPPELKKAGSFKLLCQLFSYSKHAILWFILGFLFLIVYAVARVGIPKLTGEVITTIVNSKSQTEGFQNLMTAVLKMTGLVCISSIFGGLRGGAFSYASMIVNCRMRCDLFRALMQQEIAFYDTTKTGEITSRLSADCQTMASTLSTNLNVLMRNGVMLIGSLIIMIWMSWQLVMVTFTVIPLIAFVTKAYGAYYDKLSEKTQKALADANHVAEQTISTMRTVRSFACEDREADKFEGFVDETVEINKKRSIAYMCYTWITESCDNVVLVAVLFYGGHLVLAKKMTADHLIAFLLYQLQLGENFANLNYVFTGLMEAVGASRKVFEYMLREPQVANNGTEKPPVEGAIEFADVTFAYPSRANRKVLDGISFKVNAGETVALVGPSGGGKSTCVALLEHFYHLLGGEIRLDGVDISKIQHHYLHGKIALVAQEPVLYEGTVAENILYGFIEGTAEEREELMISAARMANVYDFVMQMDKQFDTNCGERGVQMSGGQKQRIAIARALVRDPAVLILDEATSALDTESEHSVQEAITKWSRLKKTVIVIAHRLSTVERADKILVITGGKVIQSGSHAELLREKEKLYFKLVNRQLLSSGDSQQPPLTSSSDQIVDETEHLEI